MDSTLNFGSLKETVIKKSSTELVRGFKGDSLITFMESVKKNPILTKQFIVYKNFETVKPFSKEVLAERFIAQNMKIFENVKWNDIISENKKTRKDFVGTIDEATVVSKKENRELYEAVSTLIESKTNKLFNNFEKEVNSYDHLVKFLTREADVMNEEKEERPGINKMSDFILKNAVSNFNQRYSNLDENEKNIFKILIADKEEKLTKIKSIKEETLKNIENKILKEENADNEKILQEFKEKVQKELPEEKLLSEEYVLNLCELNNTIKNI